MRVNESRLDGIARGLAGGMSRREALRAGGVAFAGAVAISPTDAIAKLTGHCPKGHVHCDGKCCPTGEVCLPPKHKGGKHKCGCKHGESRCSGKCTNVSSDPHNCGQCGQRCPAGSTCSHGTCQQHQQQQCPMGETLCSGVCVDQSTDASACGPNCDNCSALVGSNFVASASCVDGACQVVCDPDWQNCSGNPLDGCPCLGTSMSEACNPDGTCMQT